MNEEPRAAIDVSVMPEHRLTEDELEAFWQDGYLMGRRALRSDEASEAVTELDRVVADAGWAGGPDGVAVPGRLASQLGTGPNPAPFIESRHLDQESVLGLCRRPEILGVVSSLVGETVVLWRSTIIDKRSGTKEFRWHQDFGGVYSLGNEYGLEPPVHVSAWLALTPAHHANGCLQFARGTREVVPGRPARDEPMGTPLVPAPPAAAELVEAHLNPGEFVVFTDRVLHRSFPNTSDDRRLALVMRFTLPAVRVRGHFDRHECIRFVVS